MCGILFTTNSKITKTQFMSALHLMDHRGPDAAGGYSAVGGMQMGHNRLKILDLDNRSNQPFWSHDERYAIIFNGEIYNYRELIKKHQLSPRTTSDTEVIVELFARMGPRMLDEFIGMFALVIVDKQTKDIFVARDRLGVKPLYFMEENGALTIASEIAPLLALRGKTDFDDFGMRQYRKLRTFFNGRTAYKGISMFAAGHYRKGGKTVPYWQLPEGPQTPPGDEELRELLVSAVNYRCIADVEVGSYLSGGLDSTIVAALCHKPHTWTVGFMDHNEFSWAQMAAKQIKSTHHEVLITEEEFVEIAKTMIQKRKEPLSVPNEVLLYKMTQEVKTKNTVILSGEGADELFFGYDRTFRWAAENKWNIEEFNKLYAYGSNTDMDILDDAMAPFMRYGSCLDMVAAFFQVAHLHGLLRRLDNSTMLCSVEARVPFVDHRLIERMAGVPFNYRMDNGIIKAPLKRVFRDVVPEPIITRPKVGFPVPLEKMNFGGTSAGTPMDRWLEFNLQQLGVENAGVKK